MKSTFAFLAAFMVMPLAIAHAGADSISPSTTQDALPVSMLDGHYNGQWYDPARNGEGISLEILPGGKALVYFYTYPPQDVTGAQAWVYGIGDIAANVIEFPDVLRPTLDSTGAQIQTHWGQISLTFSDCNTASMRWDGPSDWGSMQVPITRLTSLEGLNCSSGNGASVQTSGVWYDPANNGTGFVFEQLDSSTAAATYFGYASDGGQGWMVGVLSLATDGTYGGRLNQTTGTLFGADFDSAKISQYYGGELSGVDLSCMTGAANFLLGYGLTQSLALQRLTVPDGVTACTQ